MPFPALRHACSSLPPGIEYVVEVEQAPHLFVIRKQQRREDKKDAAAAAAMAAGGPGAGAGGPLTLAHYYVLDKMVYQVRGRCEGHCLLRKRLLGAWCSGQ